MPTLIACNPTEPKPRLWTKAEFYEMARLGWFDGQKAELLEGEVVVSSPQGPQHYATVKRVARVLSVHFPEGFDVRPQGPIDLGEHTEPEPDVAVVAARDDEYAFAHPQTAALLVEISDTTLISDRNRKASLYARAGIADYWIVNLVDLQLEVYRDPVPDSDAFYGYRYQQQTILTASAMAKPLACPQLEIAVVDLFG